MKKNQFMKVAQKSWMAVLIACSLPFWGWAEEIAESFVVDGAKWANQSSFQSEGVVIDSLKGIVFLSNWEQAREEPGTKIYGVQTQGALLLSQNPGFLKQLEREFVGKPLTQEAVWKLRADVAQFYCAQGQPFVVVGVPRQNLSKGILQVVVQEPILGKVVVKGNSCVSPQKLKNFVRLSSGEPIDSLKLVQDLYRMNQNPFRRTDAIFRPGENPGVADLELATVDRWPYRFYMGADNTGTIATERDRLFFGFNFGKTVVEDAEISYQFTCSPNWNRFSAQTALFRIPFPAHQTFVAFGGYCQVQPELKDGNSEKSTSWQVDGRYRIPILTHTSFLQEFIFGFDFKQVLGKIKKRGVVQFDNLADIDQFMIGYDIGHRSPRHKVTLVAELYAAPGGMSHGNTTDKFLVFRPESGPQYAYFKLSHSFAYKFKRFWLSYDIQGQAASKNLLASEQFTLTGYHAVRGFEERIVNVDNALLVNLTVQSPRFSLAKLALGSRRSFDELYFLAFFDLGYGGNCHLDVGESRSVSLGSMGPGVRYQIDRYLSLRFDYGFQLWHEGFFNPTHSRYNFGLNISL
jgi:hemolysin activation/secretion protein